MEGITSAKPRLVQQAPAGLESAICENRQNTSVRKQEKTAGQFPAKYDTFHGILKRVYDMKLSGSLDSEEPSTESDRSEGSNCESKRRILVRTGSFSVDEFSNGSFFEDGSSVDSATESDRCCRNDDERGIDDSFGARLQDSREGASGSALPDSRPGSFSRKVTGFPEPDGTITETEKHQMETFFKSLKTEVFVCESPVKLFMSSATETRNDWVFRYEGIAVVILDCGDTRSRRKRRIQILLAERGTCFPLWKDTIDNLSAYRKSEAAFHTMHLSSDHRQIVGLSFDSPSEADNLLRHIEYLTSNPENINISVPGSRKTREKVPRRKNRPPLPQKKQISNPCLFQHVISISAVDKPIYVSLQTLIKGDATKKEEGIP